MNSRVWVVTGCSSGLGLELTKMIASRGDRVVATSRSPAKLTYLEKENSNITVRKLDHNQSLQQIKVEFEEILKVHGKVDILVNSAAYVQTGFIEECGPEEDEKQFLANTFGPTNVYRAVLPHFRQRKSGTLVTIGSMAAWYPMNGCNLYNASKAAIRWMTIGLAEEVRHLGIKHCLVEPGFFRTELLNPDANIKTSLIDIRIPDYQELNEQNAANFAAFNGAQLGDPVVGAEIMYEVITATGRAQGRELPGFLPLGSDACDQISKAAKETLEDIEAWRSVASQSDYKS